MIFNKSNFKYLIMIFGYLISFQLYAEYFPITHHTCSLRGKRKTMEDAHFPKIDTKSKDLDKPCILQNGSYVYGLFDGHKADRAAKYCAEFFPQLLNKYCTTENLKNPLHDIFFIINNQYKTSFRETNNCTCDYWYNCLNWFTSCCCCRPNKTHPEIIPEDGTTALIALITSQHNLWIANAGDSRAVLSQQGKSIRLSFDHKPHEENELNRLKEMARDNELNPLNILQEISNPKPGSNGFFTYNILNDVNPLTGFESIQQKQIPAYKLFGEIAVCRAIGDYKYQPYVTSMPFISCHQLQGTEELLILACDGFWDVVTDQAAINLALYHLAGLKKTKGHLFSTQVGYTELAETLSDILANKALNLDSQDNITVTVILFPAALNIKAITTEYQDNSEEGIAEREEIFPSNITSWEPQSASLGPQSTSSALNSNSHNERSAFPIDNEYHKNSAFPFDKDKNPVDLDAEEFH